jgi:hypothetical protein
MPVPNFSPGEVLTAGAMDSIGSWLITTYSIPSSPAVNAFTIPNCFSSDYDNYRIVLDTTFSTSGQRVLLRPTSVTTNYAGTFIFMSNGSASIGGATGGYTNYFDLGLNQAGRGNFEAVMFNPAVSGVPTHMFSTLVTSFYHSTAYAITSATAASTDLLVQLQSGTMSGGTCRIYGMRN